MAHEQTKTETHEVAVKPSKEVSVSLGPIQIQTAEDAAFAFLREEISEEDFRAAVVKFGVTPGTLLWSANPNSRFDAAFNRKIPDDIYLASTTPDVSLKDRLKIVEEKQKIKDEAEKQKQPVG